MTRSLALLVPLLFAPTGCIIYENNGDADFDDDDEIWWEDGDFGDPGEDTGESVATGIVIAPDHAEAGETLLITMSSSFDFDLSLVVDVWFDGAVAVHDIQIGEDSVYVVAEVDAHAETGAVSVYVETADGEILSIDVPFTVDAPTSTEPDGCE